MSTSTYIHPADIHTKVLWTNPDGSMNVVVQVSVLHACASDENKKMEEAY